MDGMERVARSEVDGGGARWRHKWSRTTSSGLARTSPRQSSLTRAISPTRCSRFCLVARGRIRGVGLAFRPLVENKCRSTCSCECFLDKYEVKLKGEEREGPHHAIISMMRNKAWQGTRNGCAGTCSLRHKRVGCLWWNDGKDPVKARQRITPWRWCDGCERGVSTMPEQMIDARSVNDGQTHAASRLAALAPDPFGYRGCVLPSRPCDHLGLDW